MVTFKQKLVNFAAKIYFKLKGSGLKQKQLSGRFGGEVRSSELLCRAACDGAVLLKNNGTLPLSGKFALFGRVQNDTFYKGYGSGGNVLAPYSVSILQGFENAGADLCEDLKAAYLVYCKKHPAKKGDWGDWTCSHKEMPLTDELVEGARMQTDTAVIVIGRACGEDRDQDLAEGSYYLTSAERDMLRRVTRAFPKTAVLLNLGNLIDFSFLDEFGIGAALLLWQGGMEAGNAAAKLALGEVSPSGKLSDTAAADYAAYPSSRNYGNAKYNEYREDIFVGYRYFSTFAREAVRFPFGFGLSYTKFETEFRYTGGSVFWRVKNTGERRGKEVVQVYVETPNGAKRALAAFTKTRELAPEESDAGELKIDERALAYYDAARSAFVIAAGEYRVYAGTDSASAREIASFGSEEKIVERLSERCAPQFAFPVLQKDGVFSACPARTKDLKTEILSALPASFPQGKEGMLQDVAAGRLTLEEFAASLSLSDSEGLARGDFSMDSPLGAKGNAGVMGGVTKSLREKGVPPITMTDGPSGIRMAAACSLLPCGTLLACSFDTELVEEVYACVGREMKERGSHVLLAPAVNIHRDPLCGRNFEYFSEDPLLTGKMGAAVVRGLQGEGVSACPKHFCCNNQEFNRNKNDSRLSERALREIYLRGFEICVKEAKPDCIMTSYNKVNGVWAHYHYDLCRGVLRQEWGFDGAIVTDWWMRKATSPEFPKLRVNAYRVRSGVNVLMPGGGYVVKKSDGTLLRTVGKEGGLTVEELRRNAVEVLRFVMRSAAFKKDEEFENGGN